MMKRILYFLPIVFTIFAFVACENYERGAGEGEIKGTAPVLHIMQGNMWLYDSNEAFVNKFIMRINCTEARFSYENGVPAKVNNLRYIFEMAQVDTSIFSNPVVIGQNENPYIDLYSETVRNNILNWYGNDDSSQYVSFRAKAVCDEFSEPFTSAIFTVRVDHTKPADTSTVIVIPDITIKIKKDTEWANDTATWTNIYVYAWGIDDADTEGKIYGGWPGQRLTEDGDGWYSFVVTGYRPIHLIINDGGSRQFNFLDDPAEDGCYEITNSSYTPIDCD